MAWELFTKQNVQDDTGVASNDMTDLMYEAAVAEAEKWLRRKLTAPATYTEVFDGDGTDTIFVAHPPIVSISSLSITGVAIDSGSYEVYPHYIRLTGLRYNEFYESIFGPSPVFPIGTQNISLTYSGGIVAANVPKNIIYGLERIVAEMSLSEQRKGSDASFAFDFAQASQSMESSPEPGAGLGRNITAIMRTWMGKGVMAA